MNCIPLLDASVTGGATVVVFSVDVVLIVVLGVVGEVDNSGLHIRS